jgi:cysteine synthase A
VTILCDGAARYASKLFNPAFLRERSLPIPAWLAETGGALPDWRA